MYFVDIQVHLTLDPVYKLSFKTITPGKERGPLTALASSGTSNGNAGLLVNRKWFIPYRDGHHEAGQLYFVDFERQKVRLVEAEMSGRFCKRKCFVSTV